MVTIEEDEYRKLKDDEAILNRLCEEQSIYDKAIHYRYSIQALRLTKNVKEYIR